MTINKGKRPIKREFRSQELKIPAQQNRKGNESRKPCLQMCFGICRRQNVPKAREETISFDLTNGMDNDQCHQPELPRKDAQLLEVASSYLRTRNFTGKDMLFLKLRCLSSLPLKHSLKKYLTLWVSFPLFEEMESDLVHGCHGRTTFELKLANFAE